MKVITTEGLIDQEQLRVEDHVQWTDTARIVATEWYLSDKLVRRDVHVNILRGMELNPHGS